MDYFWLIPFIFAMLVGIWGFYCVVTRKGGSGVRTTGKVLYDKPGREPDNPPPQ